MKTRTGFVSNSSSSSFIIPKDKLTYEQILKIYDHINTAKNHSDYFNFGSTDEYDQWYIKENEDYIMGETNMDNFYMGTFLIDYLEIPSSIIKWSD